MERLQFWAEVVYFTWPVVLAPKLISSLTGCCDHELQFLLSRAVTKLEYEDALHSVDA